MLSVTVNTKKALKAEVGEPLIFPVRGSKLRPEGVPEGLYQVHRRGRLQLVALPDEALRGIPILPWGRAVPDADKEATVLRVRVLDP
jgi:hypothetical protein